MLNLTPSRARATNDAAGNRARLIDSLRRFAERVAATTAPAGPPWQPTPPPERSAPSPFWILHAR